MTLSTQIRNWLTIGFEQPVGSMNEYFYFDKRNNEFFSLVLGDYWLLDDDLNRANNVTTNYTEAQEHSLIDRTRRVEQNDPEIISIDRISLDERKLVMQQFIDSLKNSDLVNTLKQGIHNQDYRTKFDFYFGDEADDWTKQKWEQTKETFLQQKVDEFLNFNNIVSS